MPDKSDSAENAANAVIQTAAAVAVAPSVVSMLDLTWWDDHSRGIMAICATVGASVSLLSFLISQYYKYRQRQKTESVKPDRRAWWPVRQYKMYKKRPW